MTRQARKRLMERKVVELFLQGKSDREVMRSLKIGDRRCRKLRYLAEEYGYVSGAVKNSVSNEIYLVNQLRNSVFQSIGLIAHVFEFCKFRAVHGYLPPPHLKA